MKRWAFAMMGLALVLAGLAGGIYLGPVRNQIAVASWEQYPTTVSELGKVFGANNQALDKVTFRAHGQSWFTHLVLPGSMPKGAQIQLWVRWQPQAVSITDPAAFRISTVAWPIVGLTLGWIAGMTLIVILSQRARLPRPVRRRRISQRTGVA